MQMKLTDDTDSEYTISVVNPDGRTFRKVKITSDDITKLKPFKDLDKVKSEGGPSSYYDFDPGFNTANDIMEYLAKTRWGAEALHLKDIFKACFRWGTKRGADKLYDTKKIIYSGLRLMIMLEGKSEVKKFLEELTNDRQFK